MMRLPHPLEHARLPGPRHSFVVRIFGRLGMALAVTTTLWAGSAPAQPSAGTPAATSASPGAAPAPSGSASAAPPPSSGKGVDLLARGTQQFEDQQYEESIQTLSAALLKPSNTRAQKISIYRLLALNYITLRRKDEAESAVRGLLAIQPDYELPAEESPRFRDFFAEVRTKWEAEGRPGLVSPEAPVIAQVSLKHTVPSEAEARKELTLRAQLDDKDGRVISVKLFYRTGSKGKFQERNAMLLPGEEATRRLTATVPADAVKPPILEYYLQAYDVGGLPVGARGDAGDPLRVAVPQPASNGWVLPVAIGGGALGVAAIIGGLALAGVFGSSTTPPPNPPTPPPPGRSTVSIIVGN
ncbi:MAG: hypothetical protein U0174_11720 [Polyangiaceae bacterium]